MSAIRRVQIRCARTAKVVQEIYLKYDFVRVRINGVNDGVERIGSASNEVDLRESGPLVAREGCPTIERGVRTSPDGKREREVYLLNALSPRRCSSKEVRPPSPRPGGDGNPYLVSSINRALPVDYCSQSYGLLAVRSKHRQAVVCHWGKKKHEGSREC